MKMSRVWAMPSAETFSILPIKELLSRYIRSGMVVVDPFARNSKWGTLCNDLNPNTEAEFHLEAQDFLAKVIGAENADVVLYDPPYSLTQVARSYSSIGLQFKGHENPTGGFPRVRRWLVRLLKLDGVAISCGWNSVGLGDSRSLALEELLLVCHGGNHNDTIVTVQRKIQGNLL